MKAVIYARYSSDNQREASIEGQIRECTAFAEKNGITVLRHYIDRAISAKTDNRPEFQNMIKDSNKKLFDMIIVWKLDRFARNRYDSARYKAQLKKNGVKVASATEVISDGAEGIILESMLEGFAEYYSVDLSEKVVRGMTDNALKCMFNGGTLPMGYVIDAEQHFQIDPITAPYILDAFKQYDEGATMTQIRDWLNEHGMKNTRGNPLTYNSVQHLLKNRRYIGEYQYRDILIPDGIPAIVPKDLFDRVQAKMEKNKKAPARHKAEDDYLLTTKLFCGYCGAYLCGESGTSRTGVVHHYYKCVSVKKKRKECHKKPVKKGWIEDLVVSETMKMIMDDDTIEAIVSMLMELQEQDNTNIPLYERQLQETNTKIRNLLNAIQQGVLTKSTKASLEELEATKEELENRLANEQLSKPPKVSAEFMTFWLHRFRKLDVAKQSHRKMLIDTFINAIYLYDDKMLITFNYKDGTKKITFSEIQEASKQDASGSDLDCSTAPKRALALLPRLFFCGFLPYLCCQKERKVFSVRPRIDCHTHIISPAIRDEYFHRTQGFALVMQLPSSLMENPQCIQTVLSDPRLFLCPCVDLHRPIPPQLRELVPHLDEWKVVGLKVYLTYQKGRACDEKMTPIYEFARQHRLAVTFHTGLCSLILPSENDMEGSQAKYIALAAQRFPEVNFIIAHMDDPRFMECAALLHRHKNLFTDVSGAYETGTKEGNDVQGAIYTFRQALLSQPELWKQFLYGTDFCPPLNLGQLEEYDETIEKIFPPETFDAIYYQNCLRAFPRLSRWLSL